jgi:hypothetical protein
VMSDAERAARLSGRGFFGVFVGLLVLLVTLPLLSLFAYGITGAVVGILGFGYGMHKAWTLTDGQGLDLQLSGPYRVGTGPIAPAL